MAAQISLLAFLACTAPGFGSKLVERHASGFESNDPLAGRERLVASEEEDTVDRRGASEEEEENDPLAMVQVIPASLDAISSRNKLRGMSGHCVPAKFRTSVVKPSTLAMSTLANPCSGHCVFFGIFGQLETFFDANVHGGIAQFLVEGFGSQGRNDVVFATSDVPKTHLYAGLGLPGSTGKWTNKGDPTPATPDEQCRAWHLFPVVDFIETNSDVSQSWNMAQAAKGKYCLDSMRKLEKKYNRKYDWAVRARPDFHWRGGVGFTTTSEMLNRRTARWDDQLFFFPRANIAENAHGLYTIEDSKLVGHRGFPQHFDFWMWRGSKPIGVKNHYFRPQLKYLTQSMAGALKGRLQVSSLFKRLHKCLSIQFSVACHHYKRLKLRSEPVKWEGKVWSDTAVIDLHLKKGDPLPGGDLVRDLLERLKATDDTKGVLHDTLILGEALNVGINDARTERIHQLDLLCTDCSSEDPPFQGAEWRPQCMTPKLQTSTLFTAGGDEAVPIGLWWLC